MAISQKGFMPIFTFAISTAAREEAGEEERVEESPSEPTTPRQASSCL